MLINRWLNPLKKSMGSVRRHRRRRAMPTVVPAAAMVESLESRQLLTTAAGLPDPAFGDNGLLTVEIPGYQLANTSVSVETAISADQKIYGLSEFQQGVNDPVQLVFSMNAWGTLNSSFGTNGAVDLTALGYNYFAESIAVQPSGKIVIGGSNGQWWSEGQGPQGDFAFMRLNTDGTKDVTFGDGGIKVIDADYNDFWLNDIHIRPNGEILAVGTSQLFTGESYIALMNLDASGQPVPTFGDIPGEGLNLAGYNTFPHQITVSGVQGWIYVMSTQESIDRLDTNLSVHRFFSNGLEDNSFGQGEANVTVGNVITTEGFSSSVINGGWIYMSGFQYNPMTFESADFIARVDVDTGIWDQTYGGDGFLEVDDQEGLLAAAPGGAIDIVASRNDWTATPSTHSLTVSRRTSTGALDTFFGTAGTGVRPQTTSALPQGEIVKDRDDALMFFVTSYNSATQRDDLFLSRWLTHSRLDQPTIDSAEVEVCQDGLMATLNWTVDAAADEHELWVDNLSTGDKQVYHSKLVYGSSLTLPLTLSAGTYRAWIRSTATLHDTSAWSEPFTFAVQPPAPTIVSPQTIDGTNETLIDWTDVPGATSYQLWVESTLDPGVPLVNQITASSQYSVADGFFEQGGYRIWVRASGPDGLKTTWGSGKTVTFRLPEPTGLTRTFVSPAVSAAIDWTDTPDAARYELWINRIDVFQSGVVHEQNLTDSAFDAALPEGKYRAWVRAEDNQSQWTVWSDPLDFIVAPDRPVISMPAASTSLRPQFTWADDSGAVRYELWVSHAKTQMRVIHETNVLETNWTPPTDLGTGKHFVWVRGFDANDNPTAWSQLHTLTIQLPGPVIHTPGCTTDRNPAITWDSVESAGTYHLVVENISNGQTIVISATGLTSGIYNITEPLASARYRVWMRSVSITGDAGVWSFRELRVF
ncbi:MAG: hypothetical protein KDA96_06190 [Planctomycetaceae bacterium]|nr:hypothetical protein [Planctomycetaceae bacterium]